MHRDISDEALRKAMKGFPATFTDAMNESLEKDTTEKELSSVVMSMAKGKAPEYDGVLIELFQKMWLTVDKTFYYAH